MASPKRGARARALAGALLLLPLGCGAGAVDYTGDVRAPVSEPASIALAEQAPAGFERLGSVDAGCDAVEPGSELDGVKLADLGCSRALLVAALQDEAASVGGALLVGTSCSSGRRSLDCRAEVWGPASGVKPAPSEVLPVNVDRLGPGAAGAPPRGSVADAWRIRVEAWPRSAAKGSATREPTPPERVEELALPSMAQVPIGDVRASCDEGCSSASVREALRLAAAHIGAASVVGIRCIQDGAGVSCVGSAAALIAPDERRSEAR